MTNKKIISILALFLVLFVAVGAASAAEDIAVNDVNDGSDISVNVLNDVKPNGTFADLQSAIDIASGTLELDRDYVYNAESDSDYVNGVVINSPLTIDGKNHILDGSNLARIFNITGADVTIRNINLINGKSTVAGGAIYATGANLKITDSTFTDNTADGAKTKGGAIFVDSENAVIDKCIFLANAAGTGNIANTEEYGGGSIYINAPGCTVSNSRFSSNGRTTEIRNGGAIFTNATNTKILNCEFSSLSVSFCAGAVLANPGADNFEIRDCLFNESIGGSNGGALVVKSNSIIDNCTFIDCAGDFGNAILAGKGSLGLPCPNIEKLVINDCTFIRCHSRDGSSSALANGAISLQTEVVNAIISGNTLFENCTAIDRSGWGDGAGALNNYCDNLTIMGTCTFKNCEALEGKNSRGGAIVNYGKINVTGALNIENCVAYNDVGGAIYNAYYEGTSHIYPGVFVIDETGSLTIKGCSATNGGAIYNDGGFVTLTNTIISDCTSTGNGGAIYSTGGSFKVTDSTFTNNTANGIQTRGGAIFVDSANAVVDNCTFLCNAAGTGNEANTEEYGGGSIYINATDCTVSNSRFSNKGRTTEIRNGGAIFTNATNTKILNCEFSSLSVSFCGGAVLANPGADNFEIRDCLFNESIGGSNGGALVVKSNSIIDNCTFIDCAGDFGNAILAGKGSLGLPCPNIEKLVINNCTFIRCHSRDGSGAALSNGAIFLQYVNDAVISGNTLFKDCNATDRSNWGAGGGAIYVNACPLTIEGTMVIDNCSCNYEMSGSSAFGGAIVSFDDIYLNGDLTIKNCHAEYGGAIYNGGTFIVNGNLEISNCSTIYYGGAIYNAGKGILTISETGSAEFTGNNASQYGGAIFNYGTVIIDGNANFVNNSATYGGAIYNYEYTPYEYPGVVTISESASVNFINNRVLYYGGAIYNTAGTVTIAGSAKFINNSATDEDYGYGGAIYNKDTVTISGSADFSGNDGNYCAGAIYSQGSIIISGVANFSDNYGADFGGAIYNYGTITVTDSGSATFEDNAATYGGAIFNDYNSASYPGNLIVDGSATFEDNVGNCGGAIYSEGDIIVDGSVDFSGNTAYEKGGAIYSEGDIIVDGSVDFSGNTAYEKGGAIYNFGTVTVDGSATFEDNVGNCGGAIYTVYGGEGYPGSLTVSGSANFIGNSATDGAVIYACGGSLTTIKNSVFENNVAKNGALVVIDSSVATFENNNFTNNHAKDGIVISATGKTEGTQLTIKNNEFMSNDGEIPVSNVFLFSNGFANEVKEIKGVIVSSVAAYVAGNTFENNSNLKIFYNNKGVADFSGESNIVDKDNYIFNDEGTLIGVKSTLVDKIVAVQQTEEGTKSTILLRGKLSTANGDVLVYSPDVENASVTCQGQGLYTLELTDKEEAQQYFAYYIVDNATFNQTGQNVYLDNLTMESEFGSTFTKDDGAIITTNATDGSLSQLVEIIEIYNTLPVEQKGNGLVLSQNFTYNESCDTGLVNGIPITGDINITSLIGVTIDGGNALTNLFVVDNSATLGLSNVKLTGVTGAVIDLKAGSALAADNCIADGYVQCANGATIVNPVVVVTDVPGGHGIYDLTAEVTVGNIPVKGLSFNFVATHDGETIDLGEATESDTAGIYSLESTNFGGKVGEFIVGVDLANADVTTATVNRVPGIMVEQNYTATIGDVVPVVVIVDGYVADGKVVLYVDSIPQGTPLDLSDFTLNATDGKYYHTFDVDTTGFAEGVIGLSARLFVGDGPVAIVYDDSHAIELKEPAPTISDVVVTGNYSDYVDITFTITNGKIGDNIVLHLLNGTNLTQRIKYADQNTVTFEDVYLPFYSNGQITKVILVRNTTETLATANVTWNIAKINSNVNFNVSDITSKPGVEETVLITVLDAKGEEVKQGNITVTGTGITLIGNDDGVYELVDGKATVTFKCAAVGDYSLNVAYTGGVATNNTDNYNPSSDSLAIKIIKTNVIVTVTNTTPSGKVNETITITGTVKDEFDAIPTGHVEITVNGKKFTGTIDSETGAYSIEVSANESGKWTDTVKFISEDPTVWADAESVPVTVSVRKLHTNIVSNYTFIGDDAFNGTYGEQMTLNFTVFDENGNLVKDGQLIFWFNGIAYTTDVVDGYASITDKAFVWTSTGLYNYVVDYVNNGKVYYDSFNFTNVNIPKIATKVVIDKNVTDSIEGGQVTITFNVTDVEGKVTVTKGVIYYVTPDGIEHSVNVENGVATATIKVTRTGTYYIAASYYDLDGDFLYSEADFTWDIQLTETLIKVTNSADGLLATIKVNDDLGNKVNGNVNLFVNGKLMSLNVVNGVASVNLGAYNGPVELNAVFTGADGLVSSDSVIVELAAIPENGPTSSEGLESAKDVKDVKDVKADNETAPEVDNENDTAPASGVEESPASGIPMQHTAIPVLALILALLVLPLGYRRD